MITAPLSSPDDEVPADLGYAEAVAELDEILGALDRDTVDVDDLAHQARRAAALIRHCRSRIAEARTEVEQIVVDLEDLAIADDRLVGGPGVVGDDTDDPLVADADSAATDSNDH